MSRMLRAWCADIDPLVPAGIAALLVLLWLVRRALAGWRRADWHALHAGEDGAAYSLSYVMVFPFFLLFVCLVIETALFLVVKMGTAYAAFAAARTNLVWRSLDPARAETKTRQAAVNVMAGFASSSSVHAQGAGITGPVPHAAQVYARAYYAYAADPAGMRYIAAKYRYADRATRLEVRPRSSAWNADITVTVTYEMPFLVPIMGRFFGRPAPWAGAKLRTFAVAATVTLPNEGPQNDTQSLGIDYVAP